MQPRTLESALHKTLLALEHHLVQIKKVVAKVGEGSIRT